jgi:hypothetical protein
MREKDRRERESGENGERREREVTFYTCVPVQLCGFIDKVS